MAEPVTVDIPHKLDRATLRDRIERGLGKVADMLPGGTVTEHHWEGDRLQFTVEAMGQRVASTAELFDDRVHLIVDLPPFLALFADKIRDKLQRKGPSLLK
ncbi:polyhydroxyalkanoic acid system family protein [Stakelama saccharophila]|uniref:Polyhydroxyalkanoic acid system family protein n=1 Tax=Stakelama saccharophila TaxID=3075605 RepID=A0ABZ0BBN3_9SPHN|nr:polyhydroxyalkanoic acid system family protein [Stakelama sp. W311]WNO54702.1 polyhydroxyalkanoic acid system family protein [Stakelama sp. W311]